jgi:hypothetical protein
MSNYKTLEELKKAFQEKNTKSDDGGDRNANAIWKKRYDFFKINAGETAVVRFLPDANVENPLVFVKEIFTHKLRVNGHSKTIPCLKRLYNKPCPCCELSAKYYAEGNDKLGLDYYIKRSYLIPILLVKDPLETEDQASVKYIDIGPKIYKIILNAIGSDDLDAAPYAYKGGYDFRLVKEQQGDFGNYDLSKFSPKQTSLSDEVIDNLELINLDECVPKEIPREEMEAMIYASQTDTQYVWGKAKAAQSTDKSDVPDAEVEDVKDVASYTTKTQSVEAPKEDNSKLDEKAKMQAVLDKIRNKANAQRSE